MKSNFYFLKIFILLFFSLIGLQAFADEPTSNNMGLNISNKIEQNINQFISKVSIAIDVKNKLTYVRAKANLSSLGNGTIYVLDTETGKVLSQVEVPSKINPDKYQLALSPKGQVFALNVNGPHCELFVLKSDSFAIGKYYSINEIPVKLNNNLEADSLLVREDEAVDLMVSHQDNSNLKEIVSLLPSSNGKYYSFIDRVHMSAAKVINGIYSSATPPDQDSTQTQYAIDAAGYGAGFTAGLLTGMGFAVRSFFANGDGYHVGAVAYSSNGDTELNIGVEYLKLLSITETSRFYALVGASVYSSQSTQTVLSPMDPNNPSSSFTTMTQNISNTSYNLGAGLGIEWSPSGWKKKGIAFAFELPLTLSVIKQTGSNTSYQIRPIPSITVIHYIN